MLVIDLVLLHGREVHLTLLPLSNVQCIRLTWVICSFCINISWNARTWFQSLFSLFYGTTKKQHSLLLWCANKMTKFRTHHSMNLIYSSGLLGNGFCHEPIPIYTVYMGFLFFPELELFLDLLDVFPSHLQTQVFPNWSLWQIKQPHLAKRSITLLVQAESHSLDWGGSHLISTLSINSVLKIHSRMKHDWHISSIP